MHTVLFRYNIQKAISSQDDDEKVPAFALRATARHAGFKVQGAGHI